MWSKSAKYLILLLIIALLAAVFFIYRRDIDLFAFFQKQQKSKQTTLSLGKQYLEQGEYTSAYENFREAHSEAPTSPDGREALLQMARLAQKIRPEEAIEHWKTVTEDEALAEHNPEAFYSTARLYDPADSISVDFADLEKAEKIYEHVFNSYHDNRYAVLAGLRLVELLEQQEQLAEAKKIIDTLTERKVRSPDLEQARYHQNITLLFSPLLTEKPKSIYYVVQSGDVLEKIAGKFGTTVDLIMENNHISDPRRIQVGSRIKVVTDKFHIVVSKSENTLSFFTEDMLIKKYSVGTGKYGKTPVGSFIISDKIKEPPWYKKGRVILFGDPENVLGTRWMTIKSTDPERQIVGYGIHGTWDEETIGSQSSEGCIRLCNSDVEELFKIVPVGTKVQIIE